MTEPQVPQQVQLHVSWSAANEVPVAPVNQFAAVLGPPTKNGTPDGIFRNRLNDLIEALQGVADAYDASAKSGSETETKE